MNSLMGQSGHSGSSGGGGRQSEKAGIKAGIKRQLIPGETAA